MKPVTLIFAILSLLLYFPTPASACDCIEPKPPRAALEEAGAVFSGTVTDVSQTRRSSSSGSLSGSLGKKVSLGVERSWKGISTSTVTIETGIGGGDCGFDFEKGKSYLVYTEGPNPRSANICSRTKELAAASDDLRELGSPTTFTNSASQPTSAEGVSPRMIAGIVMAVAIFTLAYWLAKRWDEKHGLK